MSSDQNRSPEAHLGPDASRASERHSRRTSRRAPWCVSSDRRLNNMKGSMKAAAAIGIGYVLGRHRKFRTAAMMAAGMTVGGTTVGGLVMKRGMKLLGSTDAVQKVAPQLGDLVDVVRGDLVAAGKAAAAAAVSNQVDALTDSLHDPAERLRNPPATVAGGGEKATEAADTATKAGRGAARTGGRAATGTAQRAGAAAGGTASRVTGRGRAKECDPH